MTDIRRERERDRQREKQAPCQEPDMELDPRTPVSHPGPKAGAKPLRDPPSCLTLDEVVNDIRQHVIQVLRHKEFWSSVRGHVDTDKPEGHQGKGLKGWIGFER